MGTNEKTDSGLRTSKPVLDISIRLVAVGLILAWCFLIFRPFITLIVWSIVIAVVAYPVFRKLTKLLKVREGLVATLLVVVVASVILVPGVLITGSVLRSVKGLRQGLEEGTLKVEAPKEEIKEWPVVGEQIYAIWSAASQNLESTLEEYSDQIRRAVGWLLSSLANIGLDLLLTLLAMIIAGIWLVYAGKGEQAAAAFFTRLVGDKGYEYVQVARDTIRSVAQGVVLVALIQAFLAWLGFKFIDIPAAGVLTVIVLIAAVVQLPVGIIMLPLIVYVFSYASTGAAVAFAIWGVFVSLSDAFLKPLLLGRGLQIPMLVILIGAIGGMMFHGVIGLFVGPVIMAFGYMLYLSWLQDRPVREEEAAGAAAEAARPGLSVPE